MTIPRLSHRYIANSLGLLLLTRSANAQEVQVAQTCNERAERDCIAAGDLVVQCRAKMHADCTRDEGFAAKLQNADSASGLFHAAFASYLRAFRATARHDAKQRTDYLNDMLAMLDHEVEEQADQRRFGEALYRLNMARAEIAALMEAPRDDALITLAQTRIDALTARVHREDATRKQMEAEAEPRHSMAAEKFLDSAETWRRAQVPTASCADNLVALKRELQSRLAAVDRRRLDLQDRSSLICDELLAARDALGSSNCQSFEPLNDPSWGALRQRLQIEVQVCDENLVLTGTQPMSDEERFCAATRFDRMATQALEPTHRESAFTSRNAQISWVVRDIAAPALKEYEASAQVWDTRNPTAARETRKLARAMYDRLIVDRDVRRLSTSLRRPEVDHRRFLGTERRVFFAGVGLISGGIVLLVPAATMTAAADHQCGPGGLRSCTTVDQDATKALAAAAFSSYTIAAVGVTTGAVLLALAFKRERRKRMLPDCLRTLVVGLPCRF